MAAANIVFFTFTLMFFEGHCRADPLGDGEPSISFGVEQTGRDFYIVENSSIVIPCGIKISSSQVSDYSWLKGKYPIPRQLINYSSLDLELENVTQNDEGEYRCRVQTRIGTILGPIHTVIQPVLSVLTADEVQIHGFTNQSIVLPCPINSVPTGEVRWVTPDNLTLENGRYRQLTSGSLLILALQQDDARLFHCILKNRILDEEKQLSVKLTVSVNVSDFGPVILDTFPDSVKLTSKTKEFYCVANGNPYAASTWMLPYTIQKNVFLNHPPTEHASVGQVIWLNKENSSSRYDCVASVGSKQISKSMDTHAPPSFPNLPTVKYPAAKTIRLECKATTTPLIWYKNGELLETNSGRVAARNNELVISNTVSGDSGIYQCESSRRLGSGRLIIQSSLGMPSPPVDVSCSSSSSKSIRISWKVRSEEQNINAFSIHYTPTAGGKERTQVTNDTSYWLESLIPNTNYSIYIRAYTNKSGSDQSDWVFCSTSIDLPTSKPSSPQLHILPNNSAQITWEHPTIPGVSITSYAVEVTNTINQKNESSVILTNQTSVTLENLVQNTNYFIRVRSETTDGGSLGEYSTWLVFRKSNNQNQSLNSSSTMNPGGAGGSDPLLGNEQSLGLILGMTLGLVSIVICATVILCRNRCFSYFLERRRRSRRGSYVATGNTGKDTVDSAPLEMKILTTQLDVQPQHLDTKGGHPNGSPFDGVCEPLVSVPRDRERLGDMSNS